MTGGAAVIVVNFGSSDLLAGCIQPLTEGVSDGPRIIVVDNFSGISERERVQALAHRNGWTAVLLDENLGFGGGANQGAANAIAHGASEIVFLNPDAVIDWKDLECIFQRCRDQPWALYSPRVLYRHGAPWFDGAVIDLDEGCTMSSRRAKVLRPRRTMPWLSGAVLATSTELWTRLGGFDPEFFLYWEDVDLSARALKLGAELIVVEDATAIHDEGGTQVRDVDRTKSWDRSESYYYYNIRNRLLFAARHLPMDEAQQWSSSAWRQAYRTLLIGGRRKFLRPAMPVRAAYRGVRDGRAFVRSMAEPVPAPGVRQQ